MFHIQSRSLGGDQYIYGLGHFYTINKTEYRAIKKEGCEHYGILCEIFGGTTATCALHHASTQQPPTSEEEKMLEDDFLCSRVYVDLEQSNDTETEISRCQRKFDKSPRQKESKISRIDKLQACIEQWSTTVNARSETDKAKQMYFAAKVAQLQASAQGSQSYGNEATSQENDLHSLDACLDIINVMDLDMLSHEVYYKATKAFQDAGLRRTFMKMPEIRRLAWLEHL